MRDVWVFENQWPGSRNRHYGDPGWFSSDAVGDIQAGSDDVGSMDSRAMALCDEEMAAAMSGRDREEAGCFGSMANPTKAAQAAAAPNQRQ
jgi:hypothetical protein